MSDEDKASEAAHESLAPSVLVVSMFTTLQRQMEKLGERLDENAQRMIRNEVTAAERHGKLDIAFAELNQKVGIQNGGVKAALAGIAASNEWHAGHDKRLADAALIRSGEHNVIGVPRTAVESSQTFLSEVWPLIVTVVVTGAVAVTGTVTVMFGWWTR